jgi:hypothetical protein
MKHLATATVLCLLPLAGCGSAATQTASGPAPTDAPTAVATPSPAPATPRPKATHHHEEGEREHLTQPIALPRCPHSTSPHFNAPESAMRYLASAWNRKDYEDLCHVTNPNGRQLLVDMHEEAVNLRLNHCTKLPPGNYECLFDHDYPKGMKHHDAHGHAEFLVGPARTPGWYMTVFEGCG